MPAAEHARVDDIQKSDSLFICHVNYRFKLKHNPKGATMDFYSKIVFTIIAISLVIIASERIGPKEGQAGAFSAGPTLGDLMDLSEIHDPKKLSDARNKIMRSIPLVRVQGGKIQADVE